MSHHVIYSILRQETFSVSIAIWTEVLALLPGRTGDVLAQSAGEPTGMDRDSTGGYFPTWAQLR